jgi:hypothetical protein
MMPPVSRAKPEFVDSFLLSVRRTSGVRDEESVIHLLLGAPGLDQFVIRKLAAAEVLQNFALLLGLAEDLKLAAPQLPKLGKLAGQMCYSPQAGSVGCQLELHLGGSNALPEFRLSLAQGLSPLQIRLVNLLPRLHHLASDHLKALTLAAFKTLAKAKHGLQREMKRHRYFRFWILD